MVKRFSITLVLVLSSMFMVVALTACGGLFGPVGSGGGNPSSNDAAENNSGNSNGAGVENENASVVKQGLPLSLSAYGNGYTITDFEVAEGEDGETVIVCEGSGFDVMPFRNGSLSIPIYCSVIENGVETEFVSLTTGSDGVDFHFETLHDPDTVVFYPADDRENRHEIAVK